MKQAPPNERVIVISRALAAERKLAEIARHRRPTDAETAEANAAYAAASEALKTRKKEGPS